MRYFFLLVALLCFLSIEAQYDHESIFPGKQGDELLELLEESYKPSSVLEFKEAKDTMYGRIYLRNDSVSCVYTGHSLYLPSNQDPSSWVYKDGAAEGINAEHNYPRSKGADYGNAKSDLYNLYPTRTIVNAVRGNLPFGEVPDQSTSSWYYLLDKLGNIPSSDIDLYSELGNTKFEPREDHKGNVARSIFYFMTMYFDEAQAADPDYFEKMRETLCEWHYLDPADSLEWERNILISTYQSNKKNPFVLDCSLAGRSFCDFIDEGCITTSIDDLKIKEKGRVIVYPNPLNVEKTLSLNVPGYMGESLKVKLLDVYGREYFYQTIQKNQNGNDSFQIQLKEQLTENGLYYLMIETPDTKSWEVQKVMVVKE